MSSPAFWCALFIIATLGSRLQSDAQVNHPQRPCVIHETCARCLAANPAPAEFGRPAPPALCGWCTDPAYDWRRPRCVSLTEEPGAGRNATDGCARVFVPDDRANQLLEDHAMHDFVSTAASATDATDANQPRGRRGATQIRPQRVRIALKRGQTVTVPFAYRPARHHPLDLYYLMDMTHSMEDDRQTLVTVATDLAATLRRLTGDNVRLGFGTFVDKPAWPFVDPAPRAAANPCGGVGAVCEPAYGFRHRLALDANVTRFVSSVAAAGTSANLDNVEGGLDALMQAVVCDEAVGWRPRARRIVVLATDGGVHFAGDGLLAGIVRPNDRRCHLSAAGEYEASALQDYPSLAEMAGELRRRKVSVIFAVTAEVRGLYERMHELLADVSGVGELRADSSNVLQVVEEGYAEFVRRVHFYDDAAAAGGGALRLRYETRCDEGGEWRDAARCENVRVGGVYEFRVHVTRVDEPPQDANATADTATNRRLVRIEEASISSEQLLIDVRLEDDCPCEPEPSTADAAAALASSRALCSGHGEFRCGACACDAGWLGRRCDCDASSYGDQRQLEHQCRVPTAGALLGAVCSDRGECTCGQCHCNAGFSGAHCECEPCPFYKSIECGGSERATCDCGRCQCRPGWTGPRCDCSADTAACLAPSDRNGSATAVNDETATLCSGRGRCRCGRCECSARWYGAFCESSAAEQGLNRLCSFYEPCVACMLRANGEATQPDTDSGVDAGGPPDCRQRCTDGAGTAFRIDWTDRLESSGPDEAQSSAVCVIRMPMQQRSAPAGADPTSAAGAAEAARLCEHRFGYRVADGGRSLLRIVRQECAEPLGAGVVGAGIAVVTFLVGCMGLMLYKGVQVVQDRRELARFNKEVAETRYEEFTSPLYKPPMRMYEVPAVVRNSGGGGGINDFEMNDI